MKSGENVAIMGNRRRRERLRYAGILAACCMMALLASCSGFLMSNDSNPRLAWQQFFACVSDGDYDAAFALTSEPLSVSLSDLVSGSDADLHTAFLQKLSENSTYEFVSDTDAKGFLAFQTVDITVPDMRRLAAKSVEQAVKDAEEHAYRYGSYQTDEQIAAAVKDCLMQYLNGKLYDDCLTTQRVQVEFRYKDKRWRIVMTDELYDIISGYSRYVNDAVAEYLAEVPSQ